MGQDSSKTQKLKYTQNYVQVQKQQHPFLGTITHLSHRGTGTKHFLKIFKFATDNQLNAAIKKANKRKQLSQKRGSSYIVKTTEIDSDKHNDLCGITFYLYSLYEDYHSSLGDMIRQKSQSKQIFSQDEVLDCMRMVCNGLIFLQDNGYKNYTVSKQTIVKGLKDPQTNASYYKVLDVELSKQLPPYPRLLNHIPIEKGTYLAPQVLQQLSNKNIDPDFSLKSDIFSLAMVVAEMCCLEPLDDYYNYDRLKLNHQGLIDRVKNLVHYSAYLKQILLEMLEANEEQRIGAVSLKQKLNTNDNKSTTDYGVSGIGNSNVTQRTHKFSYPQNNINLQPQIQQRFAEQRMPRVQTAQQQFRTPVYQPVPVTIPVPVPINDQRKNQTFDQSKIRQLNNGVSGLDNKLQRNRSTQKYRFAEMQVPQLVNKQSNMPSTFHFYYPQVKPTTVPILSNPNIRGGNTVLYPHSQTFMHLGNNPINLTSPQQVLNQNTGIIAYSNQNTNLNVNPNLNYNSNTNTFTNQNQNNCQNIGQQTIRKMPEIQIPENSIDKLEPQTPINNLIDISTLFTSQPLGSLKVRELKSFSNEDYEVLTSLNVGLKKTLSNSQDITNISKPITPIHEMNSDYESPPKQQRTSLYASNQSTPIKKVQALQSIPRNSIVQIIKQTQEDEQQDVSNVNANFQKKQQKDETGPKTYGKHHFTNGAIYQGQFDSAGNFCGNGVLYYPNGKVCYSGGWSDNSFHGFGVLNNQTVINYFVVTNHENFGLNDPNAWHHYQGEFCMDQKNGFGTLYMCNGDKFSGCFAKDQIQGYGTFTSHTGQRVSGIWNQNILKKL